MHDQKDSLSGRHFVPASSSTDFDIYIYICIIHSTYYIQDDFKHKYSTNTVEPLDWSWNTRDIENVRRVHGLYTGNTLIFSSTFAWHSGQLVTVCAHSEQKTSCAQGKKRQSIRFCWHIRHSINEGLTFSIFTWISKRTRKSNEGKKGRCNWGEISRQKNFFLIPPSSTFPFLAYFFTSSFFRQISFRTEYVFSSECGSTNSISWAGGESSSPRRSIRRRKKNSAIRLRPIASSGEPSGMPRSRSLMYTVVPEIWNNVNEYILLISSSTQCSL